MLISSTISTLHDLSYGYTVCGSICWIHRKHPYHHSIKKTAPCTSSMFSWSETNPAPIAPVGKEVIYKVPDTVFRHKSTTQLHAGLANNKVLLQVKWSFLRVYS